MSAIAIRRHRGTAQRQGAAGWLFVTPVVIILGLFLLVPILMALWVSVSDWSGSGSPFTAQVHFVGGKNYTQVLNGQGLTAQTFGLAVRNNLYYVLYVVPLQTVLSLFLAVMVSRRAMKGRNFFRMAFYFPSVTSSVAITVLWLFLFSGAGVVNKFLSYFAINGPDWFNDPNGLGTKVFHLHETGWLAGGNFLGIDWYQWLAGPSVAMSAFIIMAIFTTSGTFMLLFIAALQNIGEETEEAALIDGAGAWARFRYVTLPLLRPTLYTVITLGLIGTWQIFDQVWIGTHGGPAYTTTTPAYMAYDTAFSGNWGKGAAIAFILFGIIIVMTILQRLILGEADATKMTRRDLRRDRAQRAAALVALEKTEQGGL
ncbi:MAG TPA: sugar ABC transporter permease [Propionibacteriaceae bacterium]|nr:sugar ABC transporter permease [Propionibacteriaceae bacterium]